MQDSQTVDTTLLLGRSDLQELLSFDNVLPGVRDGFIAISQGEARLFPLIREALPGSAMFGLRSALWADRDLLGLKVSGYYPPNRAAGRDSHQATVVLVSPCDGSLIAVLDGNHITWIRTAVAGALGSATLARRDARRILILGNGLQAEAQALCHAWLLQGSTPEVWIHGPRDDAEQTKAKALVSRLRTQGLTAHPAADFASALQTADIVVTATPSRSPLIALHHVRPGTHITAMGADAPGKLELDPALTRSARVTADDPGQAARVGECQSLVHGSRVAALGDVLAGRVEGRARPDEITVFDSTGLAIHDLITAATAVAEARRRRIGRLVELG